ncbi:histone-fold-containing protein, partial [Obelidium mucronatum]
MPTKKPRKQVQPRKRRHVEDSEEETEREEKAMKTGKPEQQGNKARKTRDNFAWHKQIIKLQKETTLVIPRTRFAALVREVLLHTTYGKSLAATGNPPIRVTISAMQALHEFSESYMVTFFEDAVLCCVHAKRQTLMLPDMRLVGKMR